METNLPKVDKRTTPLTGVKRAERNLKKFVFAKKHKDEIIAARENKAMKQVIVAKARKHLGYSENYVSTDVFSTLTNALRAQNLL